MTTEAVPVEIRRSGFAQERIRRVRAMLRPSGEPMRQTRNLATGVSAGRPSKSSSDGTIKDTLSDLGITRNQSSRWQALARIPAETRDGKTGSPDGTPFETREKHNGDPRSPDVTRLADLGISKMQSSRWQALARIPGSVVGER